VRGMRYRGYFVTLSVYEIIQIVVRIIFFCKKITFVV